MTERGTVNVYMPFTEYVDEAWDAISPDSYDFPIVHAYLGHEPDAYFEFLSHRWQTGKGMIVVEHDIIMQRGILAELTECDHSWCVVPFHYLGGAHKGLGCCKFSASLMTSLPDVMRQVGVIGAGDPVHPPKHWCGLDGRLTAVLRGHGVVMHEHDHQLDHIGHEGSSSHGCIGIA